MARSDTRARSPSLNSLIIDRTLAPKMEGSKVGSKVGRAAEPSTNLPTISECFQEEKHFPLHLEDIVSERKTPESKPFQRSSISLPPILVGGIVNHGHNKFTPPTKKRPSTPRPFLAVREGIACLQQREWVRASDFGKYKRLSESERPHLKVPQRVLLEDISISKTENPAFAGSKKYDSSFPLFSISPIELQESSHDDFPTQSRITRRWSTGEDGRSILPLNRAKGNARAVQTEAAPLKVVRAKPE